jgi:hypothetical protein
MTGNKPSISFANIPDKVLDKVLGEDYEKGDYTLRDELIRINEDVIYAECYDEFCMAWTPSSVLLTVPSIFGDLEVIQIPRNPPVAEFLLKEV